MSEIGNRGSPRRRKIDGPTGYASAIVSGCGHLLVLVPLGVVVCEDHWEPHERRPMKRGSFWTPKAHSPLRTKGEDLALHEAG